MTRLVFETKRMKVAELGEESSVPDLFGELTTQNSLVFDLDEDDEIYEGYGKVNSAFPYRQLNGYTRELHEKDVKTAVLENQYFLRNMVEDCGSCGIRKQERIFFTRMMCSDLATLLLEMHGFPEVSSGILELSAIIH